MSALGYPFQGKIWYYVENSYGSGPTSTAYPISIKVLDARIGLGDKHKPLRGIDEPEADVLLEQCNDFTFHLEYIPQCGDTLLANAEQRSEDKQCDLSSLCFFLEVNSCVNSTDKTYYIIKGAKLKSVGISASHNTEYVFSMDFSVKESEITDSSSVTADEPTDLSGVLCAFNIAGSITDGDNNPLAYIVDSIDVTIDEGLKDYWDHDSIDKQYAIAGEKDITGSVDITLDEGGGNHLQDVIDQTEFSIKIALGGSGCPLITLSGCKWKSSEIDKNNAGDIMKESAPFTATGCTLGVVS